MPALVAILLGLLLGAGSGGAFRRMASLRLRAEWLILPLFVLQAIARGRQGHEALSDS